MTKKKYTHKPVVKSFNCPSCGAPLNIKAVGLTVNVICPSCRSTVDVNDPNLSYLKAAENKRKCVPDIPIGARGTFAGHVYECIGFIRKRDGIYYWMEYLLYNPYLGFKWLIEVDGHWSIGKKVYVDLEHSLKSAFSYNGNKYRVFNDSSARVDYVEGEFYWRVKQEDKANVKDFIAPPYMLSFESTKDEKAWTLARYLDADRVKEIFKLEDLPKPQGIGANQPVSTVADNKRRFTIMLFAWALIIMVHILRHATSENELVFESSYKHENTLRKGFEIKTEPFDINVDKRNIKLEISTNVKNNYLFLDALLVDAETGKGIPVNIEASYYYGYSGGESWSEGSKDSSEIFFNIPKGKYFLSMIPHSDGRAAGSIHFRVKLHSDVVLSRNWLWAMFFTLIVPIFGFFGAARIEAQRWENSDFSPYGG